MNTEAKELHRKELYESLASYSFDGMTVPDHDHGGLVRYIVDGVVPGDFLQAVLNNDLQDAVGRADDINRRAIPTIVAWLYNNAPGGSWGSKGAIERYVEAVHGDG